MAGAKCGAVAIALTGWGAEKQSVYLWVHFAKSSRSMLLVIPLILLLEVVAVDQAKNRLVHQ